MNQIVGLDFKAIQDWMDKKPRRKPNIAFTDSLNRHIAYLIERELEEE